KAPQAAAVIHSDFERGFIRAETITYDDYVALGGETGAQQAGKMRLEGKTYVVADGDGMAFRVAAEGLTPLVLGGIVPRLHLRGKKPLPGLMDCRVISAFTRVFRRAMPGNDGG